MEKFNFIQYEIDRYFDYLKTKDYYGGCRWIKGFDFGTSTVSLKYMIFRTLEGEGGN